ncbi:MAG: beta-propeller domain-containing protein [Methanocella sp.]
MRFTLSAIPLLFLAATLLLIIGLTAGDLLDSDSHYVPPVSGDLQRYASGGDLVEAFADAAKAGYHGGIVADSWSFVSGIANIGTPMPVPAPAKSESDGYSTTNVQVAGVDEGDIIKTDGTYIYTVASGKLIIVKASPADAASILSTTAFSGMTAKELFLDGDRLLVFGTSHSGIRPLPAGGITYEEQYGPLRSTTTTIVELYDIRDRANPKRLKTFEIEGDYLTSRQIGHDAYFVVNSYPRIYAYPIGTNATDIIPLSKDPSGNIEPIARPTDIGFIPGVLPSSFITVAGISMTDESRPISKETIAGSGQSVYASLNSLYIAESYYPYSFYRNTGSGAAENTTILKYDLKDGRITSAGTGSVRGHILNQFSMDEHDGYFRIATTVGEVTNTVQPAKNNIYVLDSSLHTVGALEDLAPGEKIYSSRFMGDRCYLVTFKKVDPLFVIDLSVPQKPKVLGKLKIPGFSDYLHPYDETHVIGIGKDAVDASEGDVSSRGLDFAWYQGVKMAIFDVSDVEHPKEMYKELIGDRGTESPVLSDHRAFLFDRAKGLLVLPITLAEVTGPRTSPYQYGDYVFQGAYVYKVDLNSGFMLRGKVTQYDSDEIFKKSGSYFYGDRSISRSLYIGNVLYTLSSTRLQSNDLDTLAKIKAIDLGTSAQPIYYPGV